MNLIELKIENVRGLRDLHLQMDGKNVVISGPNWEYFPIDRCGYSGDQPIAPRPTYR